MVNECFLQMTSKESAERKRNIARAARVIARYRNYAPSPNDDLGEFLSHYRRLWVDAHQYGVTGFDGIYRVILLLPVDWQLWAAGIAHRYIGYMDPQFDLIGDMLGFLGEVHYTYIVYGQVPQGSRAQPENPVPAIEKQAAKQPTPQSQKKPSTTIQIRPTKKTNEAGPSQRNLELIIDSSSSSSTSSESDKSVDIEANNQRLKAMCEAHRRGKAVVKSKPKKNSFPRATYTGMLPLRILDNPRPSLVRARPSPPSEETSVGNMKRPKMKLDKKDASPNLAGSKSRPQSPWTDLLEPEPNAPSKSKQKTKHLDEIASNENMEHHQRESTEAQMARRKSSAAMTNADKSSEKENSEEDPNGNPDINPTQPAP